MLEFEKVQQLRHYFCFNHVYLIAKDNFLDFFEKIDLHLLIKVQNPMQMLHSFYQRIVEPSTVFQVIQRGSILRVYRKHFLEQNLQFLGHFFENSMRSQELGGFLNF